MRPGLPVVLAVLAAAAGLAGCAGPGTSACAPPVHPPVALSGDDRRDPFPATDGAAGGVVVWESGTGGSVEAAWRVAPGQWSAPSVLSAAAARDPVVAMSEDGVAVAVWQRQPAGEPERVEASTGTPAGGWSAPVTLSTSDEHAREPQVGVSADGTFTVAWRRDLPDARSAIETVTRPPDGAWTAPRRIAGSEGGAKRPRLAVSLDGGAALVWEVRAHGVSSDPRGVAAAVRPPGGEWSAAQPLSTGVSRAREPSVAIGRDGAAVAVWLGADRGGFGAFVADRDGATWTAPHAVGRGSGAPHEIARPGRVETGAAAVMLVDGTAVVGWTVNLHGTALSEVAVRGPGGWGPPLRLSRNRLAGGVQLAAGPAGAVLAGWEEVDGGLLRARVARVAGTSPPGCSDLAAGVTQSAGVRLAGGVVPVAAFVDLRRSRVEVTE